MDCSGCTDIQALIPPDATYSCNSCIYPTRDLIANYYVMEHGLKLLLAVVIIALMNQNTLYGSRCDPQAMGSGTFVSDGLSYNGWD